MLTVILNEGIVTVISMHQDLPHVYQIKMDTFSQSILCVIDNQMPFQKHPAF